jgi:hypothetical protein
MILIQLTPAPGRFMVWVLRTFRKLTHTFTLEKQCEEIVRRPFVIICYFTSQQIVAIEYP